MGSAVVPRGAGFPLDNQLTDFDGPGTANEPQPGKRPRSSTSPTIVVRKGRPVLIIGGAGGSTIPMGVVGAAVCLADFGASVPSAVDAERIDARGACGITGPLQLCVEEARLAPSVVESRRARGHEIVPLGEYAHQPNIQAAGIEPRTGTRRAIKAARAGRTAPSVRLEPYVGGVRSPDRLAGLAHVATCSFLAARLAPSGQFFVALAGGVALARAGSVHGLRAAYGASAAAVVETVALIGPARVNGPLTQAFNAPVVGRLDARGAGFPTQLAACLAIRLVHYALLNVLFVWLVVGGFDAFVDTYDRIAGGVDWVIRLLPGVSGDTLPRGGTAAVLLTIAMNLALAVFYSSVQVLAYRRALRRWPAPVGGEDEVVEPAAPAALRPPRPSRNARLVALATLAAWVAMLGWLSWPLLGVVAVLVAVACVPLGGERLAGMRLGLALAAVFAVGAIGPAVVGAVPWEDAGQRAVRAALLVLTATWARGAAGADGVRSLFGGELWGLRLFPGAREAAALTAVLRSDQRLTAAGKDLLERLEGVETKVLPVADALTEWVAAESARAPA